MNKKIIALIITIPLILMAIILVSTQTVSNRIDTPVSGIQLEKNIQSYTRYIDNWQELEVKATAVPYVAKNKAVTYSIEADATEPNADILNEFASRYIKADAETGIITVENPNDGFDYSGKYNIIIKTNDGGYTVRVDLVLRYFYAQKLSLEKLYRDGEIEDFALGKEISVTLGSEFFAELLLSPSNINYNIVKVKSTDNNVVQVVGTNQNANSQTVKLKSTGYGTCEIIAEYFNGPNATEASKTLKFKVNVVETLHEKVVENIEIVSGIDLDNMYALGTLIDIDAIRYKVSYVGDYYQDEFYNLTLNEVSSESLDSVNGIFKTDLAGTHKFKITFSDFEKEFEYKVAEKTIDKVVVTYVENGKTYQASSSFDNVNNKFNVGLDVKKDSTILFKDFFVQVKYTNSVYADLYKNISFDAILSSDNFTKDGMSFNTNGSQIKFNIDGLENVNFTISVMQKTLVDIELVGLEKYFTVGSTLSFESLFVNLIYDFTNYNETINLTETMVAGFTTTQTGIFELTVTYEGISKEYQYIVDEKTVSEIVVSKDFQNKLVLGSNIDLESVELLVLLENGEETVITLNEVLLINEFDTSSLGAKHLNIRYGGVNYSIDYVVLESQEDIDSLDDKEVDSIEYVGNPYLLQGTTFEEFTKNNQILVNYKDQTFTSELINLNSDGIEIVGYDSNSLIVTIEITYKGASIVEELQFVPDAAAVIYLDQTFDTSYLVSEVVDLSSEFVWVQTMNGFFKRAKLSELTSSSLAVDTTSVGVKELSVMIDDALFTIYYEVRETEADFTALKESATLAALSFKDKYHIGEAFDAASLQVLIDYESYNDYLFNNIEFSDLSGSLFGFTAGVQTAIYEYNSQELELEYQVLPKELEKIEISGLEESYEIGDIVNIKDMVIKYYYNNGYGVEVKLLTKDSINDINKVLLSDGTLKTDAVGEYSFKISGSDELFKYLVTLKQVKEIVIISGFNPLEGLILGETLDFNSIIVDIIFKDPNALSIRTSLAELNPILNGSLDEIGSKTLTVTYQDFVQEFEFEVSDKKVVSIKLNKLFNNIYLLYQQIDLSEYKVVVTYNNGETEEVPLTLDLIKGTFGTDTIDTKEFVIEYGGKTSPQYGYQIYQAINKLEDKLTWNKSFRYQININKGVLTSLGINDYELQVEYDQSLVDITITKLGNGSFEISGNFKTDQIGTAVVIKYQLHAGEVKFDKSYETSIKYDLPHFEIEANDKLKVGSNSQFIIRTDDLTGLTFEWSVSDPAVLGIYGNSSELAVEAKKAGKVTVSVTIKYLDNVQTTSKEVEIVETYEGLDFLEKPNGITNYIAVGRDNYQDGSLVSSERIFEMIFGEGVKIPQDQLIFYLVDPSTGKLVEKLDQVAEIIDGKLYINNALTEAQVVTLKAISKGNYELGYTGNENYASILLMLVPGINVNTYEGLMYASRNKLPIVLTSNVLIGQKVEYLDGNGNVDPELSKKAAEILKSEVGQMKTSSDWTYYKNLGVAHPEVNYCYEITNDIYGNGYVLDTQNITTVLDPASFTPIPGVSVFNGPLSLVELEKDSQANASVKAQDNISFLIRESNIRLDNVTLQGCTDDFLYEQVDGQNYVELNHLNYLGTTLDIIGDNIDITNCRIKNGRNVIRMYGAPNSDDPDSVTPVHIRMESTIVSLGREFLVKIGTNQFVRGTLPSGAISNNNLGGNSWQQVLDAVSPSLSLNGKTYKPSNTESNTEIYEQLNAQDEEFVNHFVKTFVTIKNCVLTNCGFFSIGLESQFSGPCLDGLQYSTYKFKERGWDNIAGTSYPAMLTLQGDVRMYDWKEVDGIDSSTLIEGNIFKFDVKGLFNFLVNERAEEYGNLLIEVGDKVYVHGGLVFYGGGKNYHMINNQLDASSSFPTADKAYFVSMIEFTGEDFITSDYVSSDFSALYKALPYASGNAPFKFYIYDNRETSLTYQQQQLDLSSGKAYEIVVPVNDVTIE